MAHIILADQKLAENFIFNIILGAGETKLVKDLPQQGKVYFQFPPKITSHGRKGNWNEPDVSNGEPQAIYKSSDSLNISLATSYLLTNQPGANSKYLEGGIWNAQSIRTQLNVLRGYFEQMVEFRKGNTKEQSSAQAPLIVELHMWGVGGDEPATARLKSVDVKYSETMIVGTGKSSGKRYGQHSTPGIPPNIIPEPIKEIDASFPYRTDVSLELSIYTKITNVGVQNLISKLPERWY